MTASGRAGSAGSSSSASSISTTSSSGPVWDPPRASAERPHRRKGPSRWTRPASRRPGCAPGRRWRRRLPPIPGLGRAGGTGARRPVGSPGPRPADDAGARGASPRAASRRHDRRVRGLPGGPRRCRPEPGMRRGGRRTRSRPHALREAGSQRPRPPRHRRARPPRHRRAPWSRASARRARLRGQNAAWPREQGLPGRL